MNGESFDFGISSTQVLDGEVDMDSILGDSDEVENIVKPVTKAAKEVTKETTKDTPKEEVTVPPSRRPIEEDIDNILGEEEQQEEEEVKPKKKNTPKEEEEEVKEEDINVYSSIAKTLVEQGIFSFEEGKEPEINTGEDFLEVFNQQSLQRAEYNLNSFLDQRGPEVRAAFDAIMVHGVDPKEYYTTYARIEDFTNLDMDNESTQEQVVREYLKRQNWKDKNINRNIQLWKDSSELEETAKEFQQELIELDKQSLQQKIEAEKDKKIQEQQQEEQYRNNITTILREKVKSKEFDGIPVSETTARKTLDFLSNKAYQLSNGRQITEWDKFILDLNKPENHPLKVKIALLATNNFDFSVIKKKEISKQSNSLFGELATRTTKSKKEALKKEEDNFWKS